MKVTRIYGGCFFPIEKAIKTVLLGEIFFIIAFLSNFFVDDIEMVQAFPINGILLKFLFGFEWKIFG